MRYAHFLYIAVLIIDKQLTTMSVKGNKNAEWLTEEEALKILGKAEEVISDDCYFLSDVADKCGTYREQFNYIARKFKENRAVFNTIKRITNRCESIVAIKTASNEINTALGIFILKSYHGLIETSKLQHEGGDQDKPIQTTVTKLTPEQIQALNNELEDDY